MQNRDSLDSLQAMRALAAFFVILDHGISSLGRNASVTGMSALAWSLGDVGVYLFFVISGFVMVYAHKKDFGEPGTSAKFANRRIGRILPMYWIFTILSVINLVALKKIHVSTDELIKSFLFIPYHGEKFFGEPLLGQGWTLNFEMFFYFIFGISLFFRSGIFVISGFFIILSACGLAKVFPDNSILGFWSRPITLFFVAGLGLGLLREKLTWRLSFETSIALSVVIAALAVTSLLQASGQPVGILIASILVILAIAGCIFSKPAINSRFAKFSSSLGNATYSTYLVHTFFVGAFSRIAAKFDYGFIVPLTLAIGVVASFAAGSLIFNYIEKPILRVWNRKKAPKSQLQASV